jgi:hypothetical protein
MMRSYRIRVQMKAYLEKSVEVRAGSTGQALARIKAMVEEEMLTIPNLPDYEGWVVTGEEILTEELSELDVELIP